MSLTILQQCSVPGAEEELDQCLRSIFTHKVVRFISAIEADACSSVWDRMCVEAPSRVQRASSRDALGESTVKASRAEQASIERLPNSQDKTILTLGIQPLPAFVLQMFAAEALLLPPLQLFGAVSAMESGLWLRNGNCLRDQVWTLVAISENSS